MIELLLLLLFVVWILMGCPIGWSGFQIWRGWL